MSGATDRSRPLTVDAIVEAAYAIVRTDGLRGLSMRRLGAALGVDPMAVYHHVTDKQALLALVTARALAEVDEPQEASTRWDVRVEQWALGYWDVVAANRELTLAGLSDPEIAAGGLRSTRALFSAVSDSGLADELVEPTVFIIVDAVHGSALGAAAPRRDHANVASLRAAFTDGLRTIISGIAGRTLRTESAAPIGSIDDPPS